MAKFLVLNGPNLNLLGVRQPDIYGTRSLADINRQLRELAHKAGHELEAMQSNAEHDLIERIHRSLDDDTAAIIFNPGAYTHTSIALRDALLGTGTPFYEVHLSDPATREQYRRHSYLSDIAVDVFKGRGGESYAMAMTAAMQAYG